jgi:hypothetical protein
MMILLYVNINTTIVIIIIIYRGQALGSALLVMCYRPNVLRVNSLTVRLYCSRFVLQTFYANVRYLR